MRQTLVVWIGLTVASIADSHPPPAVCVMRRVCGNTEFGLIPCNNHSEPAVLTPVEANIRSLSLLEAMCPDLQNGDNPVVCCDEFQLEGMFVTLYNLAHMGFNRCPQCLRNLEKLFCQMYCSTNQSQFIRSKKFNKQDTESGTQVANEIDYYLSQQYADGIFRSCKDVTNFEGRLIHQFCRPLGAGECTLRDWFRHLGTDIENEGLSPFTINFHITEESEVKDNNLLFKPLNGEYIKCSEDIDLNLKACDCHQCSDSCPPKTKRETTKCLMKGICGETAFGGIPCKTDEEPKPITESKALEVLRQMCPHLATGNDAMLCCTEDQLIRLNQTFEMISMFLKECPSCVRNFEKVFCHLSCSPDQMLFMKITKTTKSTDDKDMVSEVEYFLDDGWAKGVYDSCKGVHRLGFNVLDHYCKPYKSGECNHQKFLQFIGGDQKHFGHSPFAM